MKLLTAGPSPYGRKVVITLHETGQIDSVELVAVSTSPLAPDPTVAAANPVGKIPALIRDGGPALYDSRVICRYLDARAGGGLYPDARLWEVLTLEATADGIMDAAILMRYEILARPEDKRSSEWVEGQWGKIARSLDALEGRWISHLSGPIDMGQIAVACALGYLDFRLADRDWHSTHPALAKWYDAFAARDSMKATAPA